MTGPKRKRDLGPWRLGAVMQEVISHAILLGLAWFGGFGYLGTVLVLSAEVLLICMLSIFIFPERGMLRHLGDLVKVAGILGFLLIFVFLGHGLALRGGDDQALAYGVAAVLDLDPVILLYALAYTALHLVAMAIYARTRPQPRKEWVRLATTQGATTFVALFLLIFAAIFLGVAVVNVLRWILPGIDSGDVLVLFAVVLRFGIALLVSRMPEKDLDEIAAKPYVD